MKRKTIFLAIFLTTMSTLASAQGASTDLQLNVTNTEPVPLQSGEYADIWFRVTNEGNTAANDAAIEIKEEFPFHTDDRRDRWEIGELNQGETYLMRAQVRVNENAVFGENDLKLRKTSGNQDVWVTDRIPFEVRTDDRSLIMRSLDFPEKVEPGSSADMTLNMENLANSRFKNIDVTLDTTELPVSTRESSRQRVSGLSSGENQEVSFTLDVDGDADNELHDLPIRITYQDQAGNQLNATETTGINIGGFPNIDVAVEESEIRTPGRGDVTFRIVNKGEGQARFAEVELEESDQYEILSESSIYLGSMIDDDFQTAEFDLYVREDENLELPVNVNYRDGEGDQTESFSIDRRLYSSDELREYGLDQTGSGWIVAALALVALAAAGAYYWRRRRE